MTQRPHPMSTYLSTIGNRPATDSTGKCDYVETHSFSLHLPTFLFSRVEMFPDKQTRSTALSSLL